MKVLTIYTDGGARNNPGPAGIGVVIKEGRKVVERYCEYIGKATNNQAEYQAVIAGLQRAKELGAKEAHCYLDSELVVNQLNRRYRVKDKDLAPLFVKVWNLSLDFQKVIFIAIPREKNKEADKLVNEALDKAGFI